VCVCLLYSKFVHQLSIPVHMHSISNDYKWLEIKLKIISQVTVRVMVIIIIIIIKGIYIAQVREGHKCAMVEVNSHEYSLW